MDGHDAEMVTAAPAVRLRRFVERARRMLQTASPFVSIAQVAATCSYYDHAHLDRDFSELAGCSPSELLAEYVPTLQDADRPGGAS